MHPDEQVRAYLWDIRDAAREITGFVRDVKFEEFEKNKILRYAVERQLNLIGDVASQISPKFRKSHSEIEWNRLTELRRLIERQYGKTLAKRTWLTATSETVYILQPLEAEVLFLTDQEGPVRGLQLQQDGSVLEAEKVG